MAFAQNVTEHHAAGGLAWVVCALRLKSGLNLHVKGGFEARLKGRDKRKDRKDKNWREAGTWMKADMLRMSPQLAKWRVEEAAHKQRVMQARVHESWKHHTARHTPASWVTCPQACRCYAVKPCTNILASISHNRPSSVMCLYLHEMPRPMRYDSMHLHCSPACGLSLLTLIQYTMLQSTPKTVEVHVRRCFVRWCKEIKVHALAMQPSTRAGPVNNLDPMQSTKDMLYVQLREMQDAKAKLKPIGYTWKSSQGNSCGKFLLKYAKQSDMNGLLGTMGRLERNLMVRLAF